ncbi:hypothetical protein EJB05_54541, partial [Eragrostis curvula]
MVVDLSPYILVLPLIAIPLIFLALSRGRDGQRRLPPGPWALPVIGHLHPLAGAAPHRALRDLARRHGPLMMLRFCELPVVVASSPDAAREIFRTHDVDFASRPIGPMLQLVFRGAEGLVFAPYGDAWRQLRKICTLELFSSRRVHSFRPVRQDELGRLLRSVASAAAAGITVNLTDRIKAFVADSAVRAIIGSRSEHRDEFLRLLEEALKIIPGFSLPDLFPSSRLAMLVSRVPRKIERRRRGMFAIIDPIIQEHQEKIAAGMDEDEDLLDVLLRLQKDMDGQYPLTTQNIKSVIIHDHDALPTLVDFDHRNLDQETPEPQKIEHKNSDFHSNDPSKIIASMAADLQLYLQFVLLLVIPLVLITTARRAARRRHGAAGRLPPPGPWALPIIGHLHHLAGALPHRALRDLARRHGPLMTLRFGEVPVVVASSPAAAREIMKTHDAAFSSRPMSPMQEMAYQGNYGVIFAPYGDGWRQLRKICALEILSSRRVQSFRPVREDETRRLLRAVAAAAAASSTVNLTERISAYVADSTVRAIIGSRFERRDEYLRMLHEGLKIVPGMTLPDLFPSSRLVWFFSRAPGHIMRHSHEMKEFMDTIIKERHESRASGDDEDEDLLDVLLRLQKEVDSQDPLTTDNIKTVMLRQSDLLVVPVARVPVSMECTE